MGVIAATQGRPPPRRWPWQTLTPPGPVSSVPPSRATLADSDPSRPRVFGVPPARGTLAVKMGLSLPR